LRTERVFLHPVGWSLQRQTSRAAALSRD
jgi:hypothetical protein